MATKPEFLVAKEEMLVALYIVSSLATISVAILCFGMAIKIQCLSCNAGERGSRIICLRMLVLNQS